MTDHPIIKKLHEEHNGFYFGLWAHCPKNAPVAWGARGIADRGCGFSLLPDRQNFSGPPELRKALSKLLNNGPLKRADEETKRLRQGWIPFAELEQKAFEEYWFARKRENPELFESYTASSGAHVFESPGYPLQETPAECTPRIVWRECRREEEAAKAAFEEAERMEREGEEFPIPDPPTTTCENEYDEEEEYGEDCGAKFKKVRGEWQGCYWDGESWVCDTCGHSHYPDDDFFDGEDWAPPKTPTQKAFREIVGCRHEQMLSNKSETFTLFDDGAIVIQGNTNASHGYVYLIAYPKHDEIDESNLLTEHPGWDGDKSLAKEDDVIWSGVRPIPQPGDKVTILEHGIGLATVIAHRVEHNHLHLITVPDGPLPDWWHIQNKDRYFPPAQTWNVLGREIGEEVIRAGEDDERKEA